MNPQALQMIHNALKPMMKRGCRIEHIKLVVCPHSRIAGTDRVQTRYGLLRIKTGEYVPKGFSYLIEDSYKGFAWVSKIAK
ncbi:hypothetical protein ACFOLF_12330 [Paenibacillus sepulcri]|uniref:Uncharacterized protein n=1 Tax=Paenibacillus sepulcri TaxID=359917 RepID=A0ABS7BVF4_9BACL|nr:hypothetical protein [Paenibacillus sepulcri]